MASSAYRKGDLNDGTEKGKNLQGSNAVMQNVAETLTQDFIPYEKPEDNSLLMANEKRVLDWAAEFVNLQKDGVEELCDFFEQKIKELQHD